ncbi:hypothetical protein CMQ_4684 [Grosmannia clavigera kw1407]|uniref:Rrn9 domain-containing protein n=1 Tax=Grosmannia clavigera (strain kw1407 / UAMH 11150) TaxID=655863 RepID=F0XU34_GROCL|nr:uncharacterized protein CMQ_4684 [Grosmannia clavigera kw1407]EFW98832.1 hypothetical protein CMQ_4684 [Grosmannia clavigera kw1407]
MNIDDWADGADDAREAVDGEADAANMVDVDEAAVVTAWSDMDTDEIGSCSSDELYERRPNRWHGSAKAWRRMTAQDRARIGRPSEPLEEELTATILRLAKERFRRRVWAGPEAEEEAGRSEDEGDRDDDGGDETSRARQTHKRRRPDVATVSATVSSDDVLSAALLRPSVRHVISQVDRALLVLHNGRAVGMRGPLADASDDSSGGEEEEAGSAARSPRDSTTGRVGPPPLHPAWRPMTATSIDASQARLMSRWRPRDWSDVLGAAALAGFEADVVARTAQRCADLFGQSMALDTLGGEEGERGGVVGKKKRQPGRTAHRRTVYRPRPEETITADGQPPPPLVVYVPARKTEYEPICCPIADCPRADEGFARRTNLVRHLRIVHGAIATAKKEEATMEE